MNPIPANFSSEKLDGVFGQQHYNMIYSSNLKISTKGFCDIIDITNEVEKIVKQSKVKNGLAVVFVPGSTAGVTTLEADANLEQDLKEALEIIAPENKTYHHDEKWGDGNGFSHVRASLIGPSLNVPIKNSQLILGTWQQIVLCDFDNKARDRAVTVQVIGE